MTSYLLFILAFSLQLALLAEATDLLAGHIGKVGLTAPVFAGIAGYCYALATVNLHVNPWLAVGISFAIILPISTGIGSLMLKLDAEGFLLASFAIQVAFVDLMKNLKFTGGPLGVRDVPSPSLFFFDKDTTASSLVILIPVFIITTIALMRTLGARSALARVYHWIRDDAKSATAFGVHKERLLLSAFAVHASIAGAVGISFVIAQTYIGPNSFDLWISLNVLAVVFLSGTGGASVLMLLGAAVLVSLMEAVNVAVISPELVGAFQQIVFNSLLVGILIFRKRGIGGPILESGPSSDIAE